MEGLPPEMQASMQAIERETGARALDASTIDEPGLMKALRDHPPEGSEVDRTAMRAAIANNCADLRNWPASQHIDEERLVAVFDKKSRLCAFGWPHGTETYIIERLPSNKVIVHKHGGSIVSVGVWSSVQICREVNGDDAWRTKPGMSLPGMLMLCGSSFTGFQRH
tara:strand:- start:1221 stop:1718 length:498 start_codon:yes stop_codon:yes gene_type:complete